MPTALITGASSGIGLELAKLFAADGYRLILVARNEQRLNELAAELRQRWSVEALVLTKDLAQLMAPQAIYDQLRSQSIQLDVLANNAGFGVYGEFAKTDWRQERELLQVNILALTELTKLFLPAMIARGHGRILNVASTAAFQPGPLMSLYYASKAYVLSFSEALAEELRGTGVTVTALCPGPTQTGFQDRAAMHGIRLFRGKVMTAVEVARLGYQAMRRGQTVAITGLTNKLGTHLLRLAPRALVRRVVKFLQERG